MALTDNTMLKFAESVNAKDFSAFHEFISQLWQKEYSVEQLNEAFKVFIELEINLVPALNSYDPIFDADPYINQDGVLILEGHYPTKPSKIMFKNKYIKENGVWKLSGVSINIK